MKRDCRFVDCDMHVMEPPDLFDRYLDPAFADRVSSPPTFDSFAKGEKGEHVAPRRGLPRWLIDGTPVNRDGVVLQYNHAQIPSRSRRMKDRIQFAIDLGYNAEAQLSAMKMEGIDIAILFPTAGLALLGRSEMDPKLSYAIARAYNDWIHDFCEHSPAQLKWAAMLPVHDGNLACTELMRAVAKKNAIAGFLRPNAVCGRYWHSNYWEPLWTLAEELNVPLCFHDSTGAYNSEIEPRFGGNRFMRHVASHPIEMQLALTALLIGGVFERHPRLKIGFLEAQGWWVHGLLERIDWDMTHYKETDAPFLSLSALEYWRRNCFAAIEGRERDLGATIALLGNAESLCISTDFPHFDSDFPNVGNNLLQNASINDVDARQILLGGARLYGLTERDFQLADAAARQRSDRSTETTVTEHDGNQEVHPLLQRRGFSPSSGEFGPRKSMEC